jgi:hypothetical protein
MSQLDKSDRLVATEIYEKVKANIQPDSFGYVPSEARTCLSLDELDSFVELYLRLREIRASAVSRSLYRIADLYEANPTCLRTPFAPQTHRPNKKHYPPICALCLGNRKVGQNTADGHVQALCTLRPGIAMLGKIPQMDI